MTSLHDENQQTPTSADVPASTEPTEQPAIEDSTSNHSNNSTTSFEQYYCQTCKQDYFDWEEFYIHLRQHVKQPRIVLTRVDDPSLKKRNKSRRCGPLKFTLKTKNNEYKIIKSPENLQDTNEQELPRIPKLRILLPEQIYEKSQTPPLKSKHLHNGNNRKMVELHSLPNESQSPSFPGQSPAQPDVARTEEQNSFWNTPEPIEDPLRLTESGEKEAETHNNLLQNFLNDAANNQPKDTNINSNETEFISLERLAAGVKCPVCRERCLDQSSLDVHQKAMGHYLPTSSPSSMHSSSHSNSNNSMMPYGQPLTSGLPPSPLDRLANLPMQQLAQQVNRLQQGKGPVHQQNVLINIQQFGQPPPMSQMGCHGQYGRPPDMPPPYPTQPHYPPQQPHPPHMYSPYGPPPPHMQAPPTHHPMYYPPTSGMYHPQHPQSQSVPHQYQSHPSNNMMPPRPRPPPPQQHGQHNQHVQNMAPPPPPPAMPHPRPRQRMPSQPRGGHARMPGPRSSATMMRPNVPQQVRPMRKTAPTIDRKITPTFEQQQQAAKRKRLDILIPDTNDNDDCHVISMQKCNDGMPIIKNVQGANTKDEDPIVHLTDSITLSVRNPKEAPQVQQKKNEAKAVANILATRGITVTPAAKTAKEIANAEAAKKSPPVAINLNSAVSIIPTARGKETQQEKKQQQERENNSSPTQTVDLTIVEEDPLLITPPPPPQIQPQKPPSTAATLSKRNLPHQCDLCPAQYPTLQSLMNHRRSFHKTSPQSELGVPVVDLKQTAVLNKLASIGIHNYIPLPQLGAGNGTFGLPIVSVNAAKNPNICNLNALGSGAVLPLGPLRHISNLKQ